MHYSEGRLGRVFVLTIDDGEDFLAVTHEFIPVSYTHLTLPTTERV